MSAFNDQICPICKLEDWSDLVEIRQKGADGINEASVKRGDSIVVTSLGKRRTFCLYWRLRYHSSSSPLTFQPQRVVTAGMKVHPECRRVYTNSQQIYLHLQKKQSSDSSTNKMTTRQSEDPFNNQTLCLFCGTNVHEGSADYSCVKTDNFAKSILQSYDKRNDEWSLKVKCRMNWIRS